MPETAKTHDTVRTLLVKILTNQAAGPGSVTPDDDSVTPAKLADGDFGDFTVSGNVATVDSASTGAAGKVELANAAEAVAVTDTARAITPDAAGYLWRLPRFSIAGLGTGLTSTVTGTATTERVPFQSDVRTGATAGSTSRLHIASNGWNLHRGAQAAGIDFGKSFDVVVRLGVVANTANGVFRLKIGSSASEAVGALTSAAIGLRMDNLALKGIYYAAGEQTVDLSTTLTAQTAYDIRIVSRNGTVTWFLNGTQVGTTASGPTTAVGGTVIYEALNGADSAEYRVRLNVLDLFPYESS